MGAAGGGRTDDGCAERCWVDPCGAALGVAGDADGDGWAERWLGCSRPPAFGAEGGAIAGCADRCGDPRDAGDSAAAGAQSQRVWQPVPAARPKAGSPRV
jgi:hypothetical protein